MIDIISKPIVADEAEFAAYLAVLRSHAVDSEEERRARQEFLSKHPDAGCVATFARLAARLSQEDLETLQRMPKVWKRFAPTAALLVDLRERLSR